eukprot:scaffold3408_cov129-Amphora_coffeaeformis.AAC.20
MNAYSPSSSVSSSSCRRPQHYATNEAHTRSVLRTKPPSSRDTTPKRQYPGLSLSSTGSSVSSSRRPALVLDANSTAGSHQKPAAKQSVLPPDPRRTARTSTFFSPAAEASRILGFTTTPSSTRRNTAPPKNSQTPLLISGEEAIYSPAVYVEDTAADFSRQSSVTMAGFLSKLGKQLPEFKRRFFVLQPATHLYYFLSPTDTEPRGCLDLEGAKATNVETLPDGRCRFGLMWEDALGEGQHKVVLEARSERVAREWQHALETHRYSHVKAERDQLSRRHQAYQERIRELEKQVANFRLVEKDRDGALEDAAKWRQQFESLDEGIRRLTRNIASGVDSNDSLFKCDDSTAAEKESNIHGEDKTEGEATTINTAVTLDGRKETGDNTKDDDTNELDMGFLSPQQSGQATRDSSLLDDTLGESGESHHGSALDVMNVPGLYFSGLHNACRQLQENARLAGDEARTAVKDVQEAQGKVERLEKRGEEAEKHLLKLWEENCTLRKSLKHKKREKRVLVREVRNLQEQLKGSQEKEAPPPGATGRPRRSPPTVAEEEEATQSNSEIESSDEEKLINELEGHMMSSIRLHEQILAAQSPTPKMGNMSIQSSNKNAGKQLERKESGGATSQTNTLIISNASHSKGRPPVHNKPSLFDDDSSDSSDDSDDGETKEAAAQETHAADAESISSVFAEASVAEKRLSIGTAVSSLDGTPERPVQAACRPSFVSISTSPDSTPERPNPILQLDELDSEELERGQKKFELYRPMMLTGEATSNLGCSLSTSNHSTRRMEKDRSDATEELQVYHLTFYSRKIGLQFQKVPPPPTKAKGLLTDALKMDMVGVPEADDRTAAELRMIASLSNVAKVEASDEKKDEFSALQVASPVDAVLVCGFQGFDESGVNVRPKLGARLVAFDGVSVEVGRWTFDSIRKAIQSRSRPLTLSFRNDFLTTEQREILTRAVKDVNVALVPSVTTAEMSSDLPSSSAPSVHSASSYENGAFVNGNVVVSMKREDRLNFVETDSVSVMTERSSCAEIPLPKTLQDRKRTPYSFRSFSDVGSSTSSVLSAVGPLMAHLLPPRQTEPFTPDYMVAKGRSVEETPEHQDFASTLL